MATEMALEPDGVEKLSSNVMNYLVWRYLQESGYGKTAKQLQYQWVGRETSPEELPFAKRIKKSCLIHMAQDGLLLDHLQAEVKKINRQYVFGPDHGRKYSIPVDEPREKKSRVRSTSRNPSTIDRDREMLNGSPAEPPARRAGGPGKGKRKSGGGAEKRVNGDAMDIDSATGAAASTNANDAVGSGMETVESPLPAIEEQLPLISTLDIGESKGTITEEPRDLTASTSFVGLEPGVLLEQVTWSPHNRTALVTAGKNHMRVFKISTNEAPEDGVHTRATNLAVPSEGDFEVQAFCWTEKGSGAFTTRETITNEHGDELVTYKMLGFTEYGQKVSLVDSTAGWVLGMKYNPESELVVSLSFGEQGHVKVWSYTETIYENSKRRVEPRFELKCEKSMDATLFTVEWVSANRFLVCGKEAITLYQVNDDGIELVKDLPTDTTWIKMEYDAVHDVAVCLEESQQIIGAIHKVGEDMIMVTKPGSPDHKILDMALRPVHDENATQGAEDQCIAAFATDAGQVLLYGVNTTPAVTFSLLQTLEMGLDATAQILSFSNDGFLLAAAGYDTLNIWKPLEPGAQPKAVWKMPHGTNERWKSEVDAVNGASAGGEGANTNGVDESSEGGDHEEEFVHKLEWDADGSRLAFGMNGQVAVIRL